MPADVAVVEALNAEIIDDLKNIGQVQQREIKPVIRSNAVLHRQVDPENERRFDQQVDKNQEQDVDDEFAIQWSGSGGQQAVRLPRPVGAKVVKSGHLATALPDSTLPPTGNQYARPSAGARGGYAWPARDHG